MNDTVTLDPCNAAAVVMLKLVKVEQTKLDSGSFSGNFSAAMGTWWSPAQEHEIAAAV